MLISFHANLFHWCLVNSLISSQQLFSTFFLFILMLSVYYKFSIIMVNIFTILLLTVVILLSKLTNVREFFIIIILRNSTFLHFSITFQSYQTMLILKTSEVSFFTNSICDFALLTIFLQHLTSKQTVLKLFCKNLEWLFIVLHSFFLYLFKKYFTKFWEDFEYCCPHFR